MKRVAKPRPAWLRTALILLALIGAVLAPAAPVESAATAPPPAAVSTEPSGEAHHDTVDSALRVTTRRPAIGTTPAALPREPRRDHALPTRVRAHLPAPRSVVLRC